MERYLSTNDCVLRRLAHVVRSSENKTNKQGRDKFSSKRKLVRYLHRSIVLSARLFAISATQIREDRGREGDRNWQ